MDRTKRSTPAQRSVPAPLPPLGTYPDAELVLAFVYPVGTDYGRVLTTLKARILQFGYKSRITRLSDTLAALVKSLNLNVKIEDSNEAKRISSRMRAGNEVRRKTEHPDIMALITAYELFSARSWPENIDVPEPHKRTVHVVLSLKRPEEVHTLRKIYGQGFYLIGLFSTEQERFDYLVDENGVEAADARKLMEIDRDEGDEFGQKTRDTFYLADVFIRLGDQYKSELSRFLDLVFGYPFYTPTPDEHAMFLAYTASLRSGDLSRQVGAAITNEAHEVIAVGCNDVPKASGGLYWPGANDKRDWKQGYDSNEVQKSQMISSLMAALQAEVPEHQRQVVAKQKLQNTGIFDITEFGRAVHAEMDAVLCAGRNGVSTRGSTLYTTTLPCHNCTRHLIAAGVKRVVYIEPYPKSKALDLHADSITFDENDSNRKIPFTPFLGIGPRRYFDLFSMALSTGYPILRKKDGRAVTWKRSNASPRVPLQPTSYLHRELRAAEEIKTIIKPQTHLRK